MKERPIIFNTEMVKAILEGRKTQARRPVKPQPRYLNYGSIYTGQSEYRWSFKEHDFSTIDSIVPFAPLGKPGDFLWVRETFGTVKGNGIRTVYKADAPIMQTFYPAEEIKMKWTPSIHMSRWASRITLEITDVRVEQIQDISEQDCISEGVGNKNLRNCKKPKFIKLWDSIYKNYDENPWVWVYEFKIKEQLK